MSWIIQRDSYQKLNREMDSLYQNYSTTDFHRMAQAIASNIQKITQNVASITRMVGQIGSSVHDSSPELRSQLHKITHYTGQLAKDTNGELKELNKFNLNDQRQLKLQREKLTSDFSAVLNSFQNIQRTAAQKEKESLKASSSTKVPFLEGPNQQATNQQHGQRQQQMLFQDLQEDEQEVEQLRLREQAIRQLESDILDVNQIFKELATMVYDQGEVVDSIESHVESAQIEVSQGASQLERAHTYQNQARRKQLCIICTCIGVLIVFILILYYSF
ncbi:syntaxin-7 isoform X1 [Folsomia candida]|uniref:syntaxin-7 isoform X1 n=1 Tax=Folsomia candida TaxID=158441 RepID=UPI000B8FFDF3|nr:syntaxin-7 isoform X1 [Folsomia candida]